jgi:hypothetical protein
MPGPELGRPRGTWFLWFYMASVLMGWGWTAYRQMPLATPECVQQSQEEGGGQAEYEDCAALRRAFVSVGSFIDGYHEHIAALSTVIIALYTIILGRATIGLRDAAESQRADTLRAIRAAERAAEAAIRTVQAMREIDVRQADDFKVALAATQKAANAADLSAKAAIGVELPFLWVESCTDAGILSREPPQIARISAELLIKNYGRTPAFIREIIVNVTVGDSLDPIPSYLPINKYPSFIVIDGGGSMTFKEYPFRLATMLTAEDIDNFDVTQTSVYIYGVIKFQDFLRENHSVGFVFVLVKVNGKFIPIGDIYPEYHYQT